MTVFDYGLRRPVARWDGERKFAACPTCDSDVTGTLGAPRIPTTRLHSRRSGNVDAGTVNVRGYRCDDCRYVLAIAPENATVDIHDPGEDGTEISAPWIPVGAVFVDARKQPVIVPAREVAP